MLQDEIGDRADIVEVDHRQLMPLDRAVRQDRDIGRILGGQQRLAVLRAVDFQLVVRLALEALDQQQVDRASCA